MSPCTLWRFIAAPYWFPRGGAFFVSCHSTHFPVFTLPRPFSSLKKRRDGDDTLVGNAAVNELRGGRGDDILVGSAAGDLMDGGEGTDTCDYRLSTSGIQVSLGSTAAQTGGHADGDILVSIENIVGSSFDDIIQGSDVPNDLKGGPGDDTVSAGDDDDVLYGDDGDDALDGGSGDDELHPGFGAADVVTGGPGQDVVVMLGHSSDYTISYSGDVATITDGTNTATVSSVEFVRFSDTTNLLQPGVNEGPTASSSLSFTTPENTPLQIQLSTVLASIADPENDAISFAGINAATNGRVTLNGSVVGFSPIEFYNGAASILITVHDNHGNFLGVTIPITVTAVNTAPRCHSSLLSFPAMPSRTNDNVRSGRVRAIDIDDDDVLTYAIVQAPADGAVTLTGNGSFVFDATGELAGATASFVYEARDGGGLACTAAVSIQVTGFVRAAPFPGRDSSFVEVTTEAEAATAFPIDYIESAYDQEASVFFQTRVFLGGPKVAVLSHGEIVYTWPAVGVDEEGLGVAAKMYDSRGNVIRHTFVVNSHTLEDQASPSLTALTGGGFVIAWQSYLQDASSFGVYLQRFDRLGFRVGAETRANDETRSYQSSPALVSLPDGGFAVSWSSVGQDSDSFGIYAKLYSRNGIPFSSEFLVNTDTEASQQLSAMAVLQSGRWMCCWETISGPREGIYCQLYDGANAVGSQFKVNIGTDGTTPRTSVAAVGIEPSAKYPDGVFLVTFNDHDESPGPAEGFDITGVRVYPNGTLAGPEERINRGLTAGTQSTSHLFTIPGAHANAVVALWDNRWTMGQYLSRELDYQTQQIFGVPRFANGTGVDTRYTMRPCGAGSGLTGGFVVGWQEIDFVSRTMHQRLSILVDLDRFELTAPLTLVGTSGSDTLFGDVDSDVFYGDGGFDTYVGGQGLSVNDKVIYREPRSAFTLQQLGPGLWQVTSLRTGHFDMLHGIEVVQFSNVEIRINTAPFAAEDVIDPGSQDAVDLLANDQDAEDGVIDPSNIQITLEPQFGRPSLTGGSLSILFSPGDPIGFGSLQYQIVDSAGLASRATVRVRFDCSAVSGSSAEEAIFTGTPEDAAACGNSFTLTGNGGSDVFTFVRRPGGADTVTDFTISGPEADQLALINFTSITSFDQILLVAEQVGADAVLDLAGVHVVTLLNVAVSSLTASNFHGALGRGPLQVNTFRGLGVSNVTAVQMAVDTITTDEAAVRGDVIVGTLRVRPEDYAQSLVVWESFPSDHPGALPPGAAPSQDGDGSGIFGQFVDSEGRLRGSEFAVNDVTEMNQRFPIVAAQPIFGWFWVAWTSTYDTTPSGFEKSEVLGNAVLFDGQATCSNRNALNGDCGPAGRSVTGPAIPFGPRLDGAVANQGMVTTAGDGIRFPGHGLTYAFYTFNERFCCSLFLRTIPIVGASTLDATFIRIDENRDGTQLSSGTSRNAMAALAFDPNLQRPNNPLAHAGQVVVIAWLRIVFIPRISRRVLMLTLRTVNSARAALEHRIEVSDSNFTVQDCSRSCNIYHTHTTAYQIIALEEGAVTESSLGSTDIDPFNQFVVVHGFRRLAPPGSSRSFDDEGERIALSVYTSAPGNADPGGPEHVSNIPTLHSRSFVNTVTFDTAASLNEMGLSACLMPGGIVAIAWGHRFASFGSPVIIVQLFDLDAVAVGPFQIVSGFAGGQGSSIGPPLHPLIKPNANNTAVIVVWNQAKGLGRVPRTEVLSKLILVSELINAQPICADDVLNATEDSTVELLGSELLRNDFDEEGGTLSLISMRIARSNLVRKTGGQAVVLVDRLRQRQDTTQQRGLGAVYFASEEVLTYSQTDFAFGPVLPPASSIGIDFERINFARIPNTDKFPPDILSTLASPLQPDNAPASWPGLPTHMRYNYFAVITGFFELDQFESMVQFIVSANSAAALFVDGRLVQISRERRPQLADITAGFMGPGRFVAGTGLVENLAIGRHEIVIHYYSAAPASAIQTTEFEVRWRRQSDAQDSCSLGTCYDASVFARLSGTNEAAFRSYVDAACCGATFVPIPSEILSHAAPVQTGESVPYSFTPPPDTFGSVVLEYTAADPRGGRCTAEVLVVVNPVNDAPEASNDLLQLDTIFGQLSDTCRAESLRLTGTTPGRRRRRLHRRAGPNGEFLPDILQGNIDCSTAVTGITTGGVSVLGAPAPDHAYRFSVTGGPQEITFDGCLSEFDTQMRVFRYSDRLFDRIHDHLGIQEVTMCDDCGPCGVQERLTFVFEPGDYVFIIEGYSRSHGTYTVAMHGCTGEPFVPTPPPAPPPQPPPPPTAQTSRTGSSIFQGAIDCGDVVRGDSRDSINILGSSAPDEMYTFTIGGTSAQTVEFNTCESAL